MPSLVDSRLLNNLIKTEKDAQKSLRTWIVDSGAANAAMNTWATADSGDTQDIRDASQRITQLLAVCSDSQRAYLSSLAAYRTSLKDVLERESGLRTVVRDREILVGRLIKLGNKKPGDSAFETHALKLDDAQKELSACERFLQAEETALNGAKRRIFRESLAIRMDSMRELGRVMEESAKEAIELLVHLGGEDYDTSAFPLSRDDYGSIADDSTHPLRPRSHTSSYASSLSECFSNAQLHYSPSQPPFSATATNGDRASTPPVAQDRSISPSPALFFSPPSPISPIAIPSIPYLSPVSPPSPVISSLVMPSAAPTPPQQVEQQPRQEEERRHSTLEAMPSNTRSVSAATITPSSMSPAAAVPRTVSSLPLTRSISTRASLGPIPVAARGATAFPLLEVPKAPRAVGSRRADEDSSDEENERAFEASRQQAGSGAGQHRRIASNSTTMSNRESESRSSSFSKGLLLRRRAQSDTSSIGGGGGSHGTGGSDSGRRKSSFFGGIASLFKRRPRDSSPERVSAPSSSNQWDTRTDRNVYTSQRSGGSKGAGAAKRHSTIFEEASSSDEDSKPRNLIRVVNDPKKRGKALSDGGGGSVTYNRDSNAFTMSNNLMASTLPVATSGRLGKRRSTNVLSEYSGAYPMSAPANERSGGSINSDPGGRAYYSSSHLPISNISHSQAMSILPSSDPSTAAAAKKKKKKRAESMSGISAVATGAGGVGGSGSNHLQRQPSTSLSVNDSRAKRLSRSDTIQTSFSSPSLYAPDIVPKRRKKKVVGDSSAPSSSQSHHYTAPLSQPLTAADLASSLPSAQSSRSLALARAEIMMSTMSIEHPSPRFNALEATRHGTANWTSAGRSMSISSSARPLSAVGVGATPSASATNRLYSSTSSPNLHAIHTSSLSHSTSSAAIHRSSAAINQHSQHATYSQQQYGSSKENEKRASLMTLVHQTTHWPNTNREQPVAETTVIGLGLPTVVERREKEEGTDLNSMPSRRYESRLDPLPSLALSTASPSGIDISSHDQLAIPRPASTLLPPSTTTVARRKSVRLAEGATEMRDGPSRSPAPSVRHSFDSNGAMTMNGNGNGAGPVGILTNSNSAPSTAGDHPSNANHLPTPANGSSSTWTTRLSSTTQQVDDVSSDEGDEEEEEYSKARRAFEKGTKKLMGVGGGYTREEKGKGRAGS